VLVLSGISQETDIPALDYAPTWVMQDIQEITYRLRQSTTGDRYEKVYR
jgi:4-nitrophenyl phosphatase